MNIYTYYENIGFKKQDELLKLWKNSWATKGFTPIIIGRDDAKKSCMYHDYYDFVQSIHKKCSGRHLPENGYWLAAQLEIVAFTTLPEEPFYISDYDIINNDFYYKEQSLKLYWRDSCCSCFASGSGSQWLQYVLFLLDNEDIILQWCLNEKERTGRTEFGDQDFLIAVEKEGLKNEIFNMSRTKGICEKYFPDEEEYKLYHLSHNNMHQIKQRFPDLYKGCTQDDMRIQVAKKILGLA